MRDAYTEMGDTVSRANNAYGEKRRLENELKNIEQLRLSSRNIRHQSTLARELYTSFMAFHTAYIDYVEADTAASSGYSYIRQTYMGNQQSLQNMGRQFSEWAFRSVEGRADRWRY